MHQNTNTLSIGYLFLASLLSGLLLGFSYWPWSPVLTVFVAIIPLLRVARQAALWPSTLTALGASAIAVLIADWELWSRHGWSGGILIWILQSLILSLPWLSFHLIHHRHNTKLGIWALISSYLVLEWASGQFLGWWQGFQLGYAFMSLPILVQWYAYLGVTGGTLWALAINSQLFRILFPSNPKDKKAGWINLALFIILPLGYSFWLFFSSTPQTQDHSPIYIVDNIRTNAPQDAQYLLTKMDSSQLSSNTLMAQGQALLNWQYAIAADTIAQAYLGNQPIYSRALQTQGIAGVRQINSHLLNWGESPTGLINHNTLVHADAVRLYKKQGVQLLISFAASEKELSSLSKWRLQRLAQSRALENQIPIIVNHPQQQSMLLHPNGYLSPIDWQDASAILKRSKHSESFYGNYGDLVGRLSIFLSAWLLLATIVKPYRKK